MLMWGVGKDEMKGKHVLLTTYIHIYIFMYAIEKSTGSPDF